MSTKRITDLMLERFACGDLADAERLAITQALDSDPKLRARLQAIQQATEAFLQEAPAEPFAHLVNARVEALQPPAPVWWKTKWWKAAFVPALVSATAACALLVILLRTAPHATEPYQSNPAATVETSQIPPATASPKEQQDKADSTSEKAPQFEAAKSTIPKIAQPPSGMPNDEGLGGLGLRGAGEGAGGGGAGIGGGIGNLSSKGGSATASRGAGHVGFGYGTGSARAGTAKTKAPVLTQLQAAETSNEIKREKEAPQPAEHDRLSDDAAPAARAEASSGRAGLEARQKTGATAPAQSPAPAAPEAKGQAPSTPPAAPREPKPDGASPDKKSARAPAKDSSSVRAGDEDESARPLILETLGDDGARVSFRANARHSWVAACRSGEALRIEVGTFEQSDVRSAGTLSRRTPLREEHYYLVAGPSAFETAAFATALDQACRRGAPSASVPTSHRQLHRVIR